MVQIIEGERVGKHGRLAIGCSASVFDETGRMLLIRRMDNGRWAVPGGYMEPGESVAEACVREVREETGLTVKVERMIAVYSTPDKLLVYPDGNRWQLVVLHFTATPISGLLSTSDETAEIGYFLQSDIAQLVMGDLDRQRAIDGFAPQTAVIIR